MQVGAKMIVLVVLRVRREAGKIDVSFFEGAHHVLIPAVEPWAPLMDP